MAPRARRGGEIDGLKGRIAEAFVESIFRRAGYRVSRAGSESERERPVRIGEDEFLPDFLLHHRSSAAPAGRPRTRLLPIDVKYCPSVEVFLATHGEALLSGLRARWPELCLVLVTDRPGAGRSCFQVVNLPTTPPGAPLLAVDLHYVAEFDVYLTTVQEYDGLVRQIFPLLRLGSPLARTV
jgi:hypothetical protein